MVTGLIVEVKAAGAWVEEGVKLPVLVVVLSLALVEVGRRAWVEEALIFPCNDVLLSTVLGPDTTEVTPNVVSILETEGSI